MSNKQKYAGIIPPIVTPLTEDEKVDEKALKKLIDHCLKNGCDGIFVNGSCGEAMRITDDVWERAMRVTLEHVAGRAPVLCGAIDSSTTRQLEKIHKMKQAGAELAVCTVPFYHHVFSEDETIAHYRRLNDEGDINIAVYNIPDTTGMNILPKTLEKLLSLPRVAVVKDSCADFQQIQRELTLLQGRDISFFNGAEELVGASTLFGADGNIPGLACFMPALFASLYACAKAGDLARTLSLQQMATRLRDVLFVGGSWIASMKYLLEYFGLGTAKLSFPFRPLTDEQKASVRAIVQEVEKSL